MVADPTIILDSYHLPTESCLILDHGIAQDLACILSNASFNPDSSIGPSGTSTIVLAPSLDYFVISMPRTTTG